MGVCAGGGPGGAARAAVTATVIALCSSGPNEKRLDRSWQCKKISQNRVHLRKSLASPLAHFTRLPSTTILPPLSA